MMTKPEVNSLSPHSAYKPSSVSWLEKVPEHWEVTKLRHILTSAAERNRPDLPLLSVVREKGVILRDLDNPEDNHNIVPEDLTNYKVVHQGQFAMNKMKAWQGSYGVSPCEGVVSPAYFIFDIKGVDGIFFHSAVRSRAYVPFFNQASDGVRIGQWDLAPEQMREIPFLVPPPEEQAAIVRFLDHADEQIQRYIASKERLIALLEEQRQAVIHQAVTRGLDPNVRLKDSGVEWLGDVPEHWTIRRLKTLCGMRSGDGITTEAIEQDGKYPVYGGNGLRGYTTDFTHDGSYALIGRQGALCGNVHAVQGRFWASEHAVVASLQSENKMHWFVALLEAMNLNQYSVAAAQPGLAVERIMNLWAPVPPPQEQSRIGKHIARLTSGLTDATERARRQIELIEEYRTRLIADVVTGKIDVREESVQSLTTAVQYP